MNNIAQTQAITSLASSTGAVFPSRPEPVNLTRRFCVAPMLDWTDRHERYFLRLLSRHSLLYTEMITTGAILHGDQSRHLDFHSAEHPVAAQLGGSDPEALARCAEITERWGYDEVNLNVGCPSDRVQSGRFGACLMAEPERVADCVRAMQAACSIPVTIKSRIGIDHHDSDEFLYEFISRVADAGCKTFIVHARIAWLKGLSPKENRQIPPLDYDRVLRLKQRLPHLEIIINGGLEDDAECLSLLESVDGVMLGRDVYHNPYRLARVDQLFFSDPRPIASRSDILQAFMPYVEEQLASGTPLQHMTRHILGLYKGQPGGRLFRRHISENAFRKDAGISVLADAWALAEDTHSTWLSASG